MSKTKFRVVRPDGISDNAFRLFDHDWTLITAGTRKSFNTMTASWGGLGIIWNKRVAFIFVRPTRYTYEFIEKSDRFTLSFLPEQHRKALAFCGSKSGRDVDKIAATGLSPVFDASGAVYFEQARLVMICRKVYLQDLAPRQFLDKQVLKFYPKRDFHRMYFGEIVKCLSAKR